MSVIVGSASVRITPDLTGFHERIKAATSTIKDVKVNVDVDTAGASAQIAALEGVSGAATAARQSVGGFTKSLGPMAIAATAAVAVLGPLAAALGGVIVALTAPVGAAAVGGGLFAFLAGKYVSKTKKVADQIDALKKKAKELTNPKARAAALADAAALEKSLTGPQRAFIAARQNLQNSLTKLTTGPVGGALLAPITKGLQLLSSILPRIQPLILSVSRALSALIPATVGPRFDRFVASLSKLSGSAISKIGSILKNVGSAIGSVLGAAKPAGIAALNAIASGAQRMAKYLKSPAGQEKLKSFFDWLQKNGPKIASDVAEIAKGFGTFAHDIAPLGQIALDVSAALSKLYRAVHRFGGLGFFAGAVSSLGKVFGAPVTATGGVFSGAQTRVIGEAGPEAVVPLNRPLSQIDPSVRPLAAFAQGKTLTPGSASHLGAGGGLTRADLAWHVRELAALMGQAADGAINEQMAFAGTTSRMAR